jgi:hypothetical protein
VGRVVDPAGEHEVIERTTPAFQPRQEAGASGFEELELHRPLGLSLDDDGPRTDVAAADKLANSQLDDVAAAQLAVDGKVEHGAVAYPPLLVADSGDDERAFRAMVSA